MWAKTLPVLLIGSLQSQLVGTEARTEGRCGPSGGGTAEPDRALGSNRQVELGTIGGYFVTCLGFRVWTTPVAALVI